MTAAATVVLLNDVQLTPAELSAVEAWATNSPNKTTWFGARADR